jgi:hypothetical protein
MDLYNVNTLLAVGYSGMLYFIFGSLFSYLIEKYQPRHKENNTGKLNILVEVLLNVILLVMMSYIVRLIVKRIPYPLDNMAGFVYKNAHIHSNGSILLAWSIFSIQKTLAGRIHLLLDLL